MQSCCSRSDRAGYAGGSRRLSRRAGAFFQWAFPIAGLALVPKCPACVAAYVLVLSGIGLSLTAAATLRWVMIVGCIGAIVFLMTKQALRIGKAGCGPV